MSALDGVDPFFDYEGVRLGPFRGLRRAKRGTVATAIAIKVKAKATHCKRGHEFTPQNTIKNGNSRGCRICRNATNRNFRNRKRT